MTEAEVRKWHDAYRKARAVNEAHPSRANHDAEERAHRAYIRSLQGGRR